MFLKCFFLVTSIKFSYIESHQRHLRNVNHFFVHGLYHFTYNLNSRLCIFTPPTDPPDVGRVDNKVQTVLSLLFSPIITISIYSPASHAPCHRIPFENSLPFLRYVESNAQVARVVYSNEKYIFRQYRDPYPCQVVMVLSYLPVQYFSVCCSNNTFI